MWASPTLAIPLVITWLTEPAGNVAHLRMRGRSWASSPARNTREMAATPTSNTAVIGRLIRFITRFLLLTLYAGRFVQGSIDGDACVPQILLAAEGGAEDIHLQKRRTARAAILVVVPEVGIARRQRAEGDLAQLDAPPQGVLLVILLRGAEEIAAAEAADHRLAPILSDLQRTLDPGEPVPGAVLPLLARG